MEFRRLTAIIQPEMLESVELKLQELNVPGVSVSRVKGYSVFSVIKKMALEKHLYPGVYATRITEQPYP